MLDIKSLLEIRYFNGSTFEDFKVDLGQTDTDDTQSITLDTDNFIYVGFHKPIKQFYFDFVTANTNASNISIEYYNGTDYTAISTIDSTKNFLRSGLIQWEELSDWESNEIDSDTFYWLRISTDTLHSAAEYNFIGLLYSDDRQLSSENPYILDSNMLMGQANHLQAHAASRDMIIQRLSNKKYQKINSDSQVERITGWDLLDIQEVRQGATFLALSKIYFNLSDSVDDSWSAKSDAYYERFEEQMHLASLTVDVDDDGDTDNAERQSEFITRTIIR